MKFIKKLNNKGFGHLELLLVIVVVALVAGTGFFVYQHHKKHDIAHAGSYTPLIDYFTGKTQYHGISVFACKTYTPVFGGVYNLTILYVKKPSTPSYEYDAWVFQPVPKTPQANSNLVQKYGDTYWAGTVGSITVPNSVPLGDSTSVDVWSATGLHNKSGGKNQTSFEVGTFNGQNGSWDSKRYLNWSQIANCS